MFGRFISKIRRKSTPIFKNPEVSAKDHSKINGVILLMPDSPIRQTPANNDTLKDLQPGHLYPIPFIQKREVAKISETGEDEEKESKPSGRPLTDKQYNYVKEGIDTAKKIASNTIIWLYALNNRLLPTTPERTYPPPDTTMLDTFKAHFKSDKRSDATEILQNAITIRNAVLALTKKSFQTVDPKEAEKNVKEAKQTAAFVYGRDPIIYLCPAFFPGPEKTIKSAKSTITAIEGGIFSAEMKGKILIHEVSHYALGIIHNGGVFDLRNANCTSGFPIKSYSDASRNAYVYDQFFYCVGATGA